MITLRGGQCLQFMGLGLLKLTTGSSCLWHVSLLDRILFQNFIDLFLVDRVCEWCIVTLYWLPGYSWLAG